MTIITNYLKKKGWNEKSIEVFEHLLSFMGAVMLIVGFILIVF